MLRYHLGVMLGGYRSGPLVGSGFGEIWTADSVEANVRTQLSSVLSLGDQHSDCCPVACLRWTSFCSDLPRPTHRLVLSSLHSFHCPPNTACGLILVL